MKQKRIITLTTDFGKDSYYIGVVKGVILNINPEVEIVDITHSIKPHDIYQASYILKSSYKYFPEDTIHLAVVDPGVGSQRKPIIIKTRKYYFISPDNGILTLVLNDGKLENIYEITNKKYLLDKISNTFHARDIFAPVAAHISNCVPLEILGKKIDECVLLKTIKPEIFGNKVIGSIIYIDNFGNLVTNISSKLFDVLGYNKKFELEINNIILNKISKTYSDSSKDDIILLFGSNNTLEISVNKGNAAEKIGIKCYDKFEIRFFK